MSTVLVDVAGMTCQHCVKAVTAEVSALPGVTSVDVQLGPEGISQVTVESADEVQRDDLKAAVEEAGYTMVALKPAP